MVAGRFEFPVVSGCCVSWSAASDSERLGSVLVCCGADFSAVSWRGWWFEGLLVLVPASVTTKEWVVFLTDKGCNGACNEDSRAMLSTVGVLRRSEEPTFSMILFCPVFAGSKAHISEWEPRNRGIGNWDINRSVYLLCTLLASLDFSGTMQSGIFFTWCIRNKCFQLLLSVIHGTHACALKHGWPR